MASVHSLHRRQKQDSLLTISSILEAVITPAGADGAATVTFDEPADTPVTLCETESRPATILAATAMFLSGPGGPVHGYCPDGHPVLVGPWQLAPTKPAIVVFWRRPTGKPWQDHDHALILTVAATLSVLLGPPTPTRKETTWRQVSDSVTGLPRARKFVADLPRHFARLDRDGLSGALILVGVDGLAQTATRLGQKGVDGLLRQTAAYLTRVTRPTDVVSRIDGEEFAIWLNGADQFAAAERAEQFRIEAPRALAITDQPRAPSINLSVGIAMRRPGSPETIGSLMRRADYAMHEARSAGSGAWRMSQEEGR